MTLIATRMVTFQAKHYFLVTPLAWITAEAFAGFSGFSGCLTAACATRFEVIIYHLPCNPLRSTAVQNNR